MMPSLFITLAGVAIGGAVGSVLRFVVGMWVTERFNSELLGTEFPIGTLTVNIIGSFLIGVISAWLGQAIRDPVLGETLRLFVLVGVLGGFTTFSTFSLETLHLIEYGLWGRAILNIVASVVLCLTAAFVGLFLVRWLA